jgi:hypothetical protein
LFIERIQKFHILLKVNCSEKLNFKSDSLFIEFILFNFIGKSLYRVCNDGEVFIEASLKNHALSIEIQDDGFLISDFVEKMIKKSVDLFISEETFRNLCKENNLIYEFLTSNNTYNKTQLIIPILQEKKAINNVIPLFKTHDGGS